MEFTSINETEGEDSQWLSARKRHRWATTICLTFGAAGRGLAPPFF